MLTTAALWAQREKTTFQTSGPWKPATDIRADAVMVYGVNDNRRHPFAERVLSWRDRGYTAHFMTGIAWGQYQDYFTGQWDGTPHLDEGQKTLQGDTIWHGRMVPYIVPTENYLKYFKERHIKPVIDQGIDAIFLEEPEFWARGGYSEAFKREWQAYYGFPWRPQHESAENTYLSNKLKYHLYYRALDEAFAYAKQYGREKGLNVRCYVPTHSLLNYSQWQIVSPEASLASLKSCDGYIAQVWTGTSREPNYYNGIARERVFETAFLEYGCMESMTRPTGRKMFFLTDPIEDRARDWADFKRNYQATFTAQLLYPQVADYEVMPWPDRIYEGLYRVSKDSEERALIPRFYSTQMQVMVNSLNLMPLSDNHVSGSQGVSVAMANSLMFQRSPAPVEGYDDPQLSNFYGLTMPLLKRGIPVSITHLENTSYADTWKDVKVLVLSYANMKPLDPKAHEDIARWVRQGGRLVYVGRDDDAYQSVQEWWNQGDNSFAAPSEHLFSLMMMPKRPVEGMFVYGQGRVFVIRKDPKELVLNTGGDRQYIETLQKAYGRLTLKNSFTLQRGPYLMAAVVDECPVTKGDEPLHLKGRYIDLFDPELPLLTEKVVYPGEQAFLLNLNKLSDKQRPQVLAAASRQYNERYSTQEPTYDTQHHVYSFTAKSPANTDNVMCIWLPMKKQEVVKGFSVPSGKTIENFRIRLTDKDGKTFEELNRKYSYNGINRQNILGSTNLVWLHFENMPDGVNVNIEWE